MNDVVESYIECPKMKQSSHTCKTCKYYDKKLSEEPCDSCDVKLGNPKWEENK